MYKKFNVPKERIEKYLSDGLTYREMAKLEGCSHWTIMGITRGYGLRSNARRLQQLQSNCAENPEVREKISKTVKERWSEGIYKERINGMLGVKGINNPNFEHTRHYRDKAIFYNGKDGKLVCSRCGRTSEETKIDVHHVDENHDNILLSNLEPLCVGCHQKYHMSHCKTPFTTVTSTFRFDSAHFLPNHAKKCKFLHGHSYKLEVTVRRRVDPDNGMVIDFGKLKSVVKSQIEEVLDHGYINNFIPLPTSENIILWIWMQLSFDIKGLYKLRLYETENNYSELYQEDVLEFVKSYNFEANWLDDKQLITNYQLKQNALAWLQYDEDDPLRPALLTVESVVPNTNADKFFEYFKELLRKYKEEEDAN